MITLTDKNIALHLPEYKIYQDILIHRPGGKYESERTGVDVLGLERVGLASIDSISRIRGGCLG